MSPCHLQRWKASVDIHRLACYEISVWLIDSCWHFFWLRPVSFLLPFLPPSSCGDDIIRFYFYLHCKVGGNGGRLWDGGGRRELGSSWLLPVCSWSACGSWAHHLGFPSAVSKSTCNFSSFHRNQLKTPSEITLQSPEAGVTSQRSVLNSCGSLPPPSKIWFPLVLGIETALQLLPLWYCRFVLLLLVTS